eukprot:7212766-Lingulodinium_polyedra.AAC.1
MFSSVFVWHALAEECDIVLPASIQRVFVAKSSGSSKFWHVAVQCGEGHFVFSSGVVTEPRVPPAGGPQGT